jgi:hypothetical protein
MSEENDNGNVEHKLNLESLQMVKVEHKTTQMIFRLNQGHG